MGISIGEITRGMTILYEDELYEVVEFEHVKRARGSAFVRAKLRALKSGRVTSVTLRDSDDIDAAYLETRPLQYLYSTGGSYVFMDKGNFEQYELARETVESFAGYLLEGMDLAGLFYRGELLKVQPPNFVDLRVAEAPPGVKGDTATGGEKPATLETGATVKVPLFVKAGDVVRVDTRSGAYVERVG
ncbi:MAG: elongation factor P [Candidatus Bipolaricaulaceae bacterium]